MPSTRRRAKAAGEVVAVDDDGRDARAQRGEGQRDPHPTSLVPRRAQRRRNGAASLLRIGAVGRRRTGSTRRRAIARRATCSPRAPPRRGQAPGAPLRRDRTSRAVAARRIVLDTALDERRSRSRARPARARPTPARADDRGARRRRAAGRRHREQPQGHRQPARQGRRGGRASAAIAVRIGQKPRRTTSRPARSPACSRRTTAVLAALAAGEVDVVGGTAWLWAREEFAGLGRRAVRRRGRADVARQRRRGLAGGARASCSSATRSSSTSRCRAPIRRAPSARRSRTCSADAPTMPPELGLFLERHLAPAPRRSATSPPRCSTRAELAVAGRAASARRRSAPAPLDGARACAGSPVEHVGNDNDSAEEAEAIASLVDESARVEGDDWIDREGSEHALDARRHPGRRALQRPGRHASRERLPRRRASGTVDKFQGQEAPISIYSMASSSRRRRAARHGVPLQPQPAERRHLAGALRCRCVVASPELLRVRCRTPRQMQLANALGAAARVRSARRTFVDVARSCDTLAVTGATQDDAMEALKLVPLPAAEPAPSTAATVTVRPDRIVVDRLTVLDPGLAAFLAERPVEERPSMLERALRIGLTALQDAGVSMDVDVVRREFETMVRQTAAGQRAAAAGARGRRAAPELRRRRRQAAADAGEVPGRPGALAAWSASCSTRRSGTARSGACASCWAPTSTATPAELAQLLDPTRMGSPLHQFRVEVAEGFGKLNERLTAIEAAAAARGAERARVVGEGRRLRDARRADPAEFARGRATSLDAPATKRGMSRGARGRLRPDPEPGTDARGGCARRRRVQGPRHLRQAMRDELREASQPQRRRRRWSCSRRTTPRPASRRSMSAPATSTASSTPSVRSRRPSRRRCAWRASWRSRPCARARWSSMPRPSSGAHRHPQPARGHPPPQDPADVHQRYGEERVRHARRDARHDRRPGLRGRGRAQGRARRSRRGTGLAATVSRYGVASRQQRLCGWKREPPVLSSGTGRPCR